MGGFKVEGWWELGYGGLGYLGREGDFGEGNWFFLGNRVVCGFCEKGKFCNE
jgi:hypothetical protein